MERLNPWATFTVSNVSCEDIAENWAGEFTEWEHVSAAQRALSVLLEVCTSYRYDPHIPPG